MDNIYGLVEAIGGKVQGIQVSTKMCGGDVLFVYICFKRSKNGFDTFLVGTFCTKILFLVRDMIAVVYVHWGGIFHTLDRRCCKRD